MSSIITVGNAPAVENDNHFLINLCSSHLALVGAFCIGNIMRCILFLGLSCQSY